MPSVVVELRNIAGTEAAVEWVSAHTVVVDRPEGRADRDLASMARSSSRSHQRRLLQRSALCLARHGGALGQITESVTVDLKGDPILATGVPVTSIVGPWTGERRRRDRDGPGPWHVDGLAAPWHPRGPAACRGGGREQ